MTCSAFAPTTHSFSTVAITNAAVSAIDAESADYLLIQGCYFGVHPDTGEAMLPAPGLPAFGSHAIHVRDTFRPRIGGQGELARNLIAGAGAEAVLVERSDNLVFHDNYIGLDPTGLEARPNALDDSLAFALYVDTSDRAEIWDNTVAANLGGGIHLANATLTSVEGNKIGVDATGRLGLGNAGPGMAIEGDSAGLSILDNVISANDGPGVSCLAGTLGPWVMKRNLIGVDIAQSDTLPNAGDGVRLDEGCDDAFIGDEDANGGNLIAHNEGAGVRAIDGATTIRGNAIFLNAGLSIDAGPAGRTDNDVSDDSLPTNFPEVTDFERQDGDLRVRALRLARCGHRIVRSPHDPGPIPWRPALPRECDRRQRTRRRRDRGVQSLQRSRFRFHDPDRRVGDIDPAHCDASMETPRSFRRR